MRTTLNLAEDVAAAVDKLREVEDISVSDAVNLLARRGLIYQEPASPYVHSPSDMGRFKVDISAIGAVLETLDLNESGNP